MDLNLQNLLRNFAHERMIQTTQVFLRTCPEPVNLLFLEDRIPEKDIREIVEQQAGVEPEQYDPETKSTLDALTDFSIEKSLMHRSTSTSSSATIQSSS